MVSVYAPGTESLVNISARIIVLSLTFVSLILYTYICYINIPYLNWPRIKLNPLEQYKSFSKKMCRYRDIQALFIHRLLPNSFYIFLPKKKIIATHTTKINKTIWDEFISKI